MESFPHPVVMIGLDEDWPSSIMAQSYYVFTHCLSPLEDIFATGGERDGLAVYSVWDTKTGDGKTFVHPCKTRNCHVRHVSFDQSRGNVELRTGCLCGRLCRWDISSDSHSILEQIRMGSTWSHWDWADDGSTAVCSIEDDEMSGVGGNDERRFSYRLFTLDTSLVCHILLKAVKQVEWWFSPGHGDKIVGSDNVKLVLWECSSGRQLFQKSHTNEGFRHVRFSPDGTIIACVYSGVVELISAEDGAGFRSWDGIGEVYSIQFFPEGYRFIRIDKGAVYLLDGEVLHRKEIDCDSIFISPDGQRVAAISSDGVVVFNQTLEEKLQHYKFNASDSYNHLFSWIHSILVSVHNDAIVFHHLSHYIRPSLSAHKLLPIDNLLLSPDNHHLLTLHDDCSISVWDIKSDQRLPPPDSQINNFSCSVRMEYAPDSSCILVWDESQLMVLQYSTGRIKWIPVIPRSSSRLLAVTFFQDSIRILIIEADGNVTAVSLRDMSRYSMPRLRSQFTEVRRLVISPTEELLAICSDSGLIIQGTSQDIDRAPLLSKEVQSAEFSPEGTFLYTVELKTLFYRSNIMVSRVDTQNWTVQRILPHTTNYIIWRATLSICKWGPIELDTMKADESFALRVFCEGLGRHRDIFLRLSTSRQIIPPSFYFSSNQLEYRDQWVMTLPTTHSLIMVLDQDHLAYIDEGKAFVLDLAFLIKPM
jgi:WD40 repeat protein